MNYERNVHRILRNARLKLCAIIILIAQSTVFSQCLVVMHKHD